MLKWENNWKKLEKLKNFRKEFVEDLHFEEDACVHVTMINVFKITSKRSSFLITHILLSF